MRDGTRTLLWLGLAIGLSGMSPVMAAEQAAKTQPTVTAPAPSAASPATQAATQDTAMVAPTNDEARAAITKYVQELTEDEGAFYVDDEVTGETRELTLTQVRDGVGKAGDAYYACADMKDAKAGDALDVDFDLESYEKTLEVVDVRIHKVNGKERYTYDDHGNRNPVN